MSQNGSARGKAAAAAAQRERSLLQLLDPSDLMPGRTIADLYSLRHLSLQGGIPDSPPWLRAQAWKVLLGYLPPEKKEWPSVLQKRRHEYYRFVSDLSPTHQESGPSSASSLSDRDALLDQIYKDLSRSRKNGFAFYQSEVRPSRYCPLAPEPPSAAGSQEGEAASSRATVERIESRQALIVRLADINPNFAENLGRRPAPASELKAKGKAELLSGLSIATQTAQANGADGAASSPPIYLSPPSPGGASAASTQASFASAIEAGSEAVNAADTAADEDHGTAPADTPQRTSQPVIVDRNWHALLRILYFYALLNPSIGYVQGMNEALFTLFYAFGTAGPLPQRVPREGPSWQDVSDGPDSDDRDVFGDEEDGTSPHAEADAFWCFSLLIGEVKELYDFEGVNRAMSDSALVRQPSPLADGNFHRIGMAGALKRFSLRLKWLEPQLWRDLRACNLDPRMPFYSFRWLACLISTELSLPSVLRVWDALLSEQETSLEGAAPAKIEFLIDICCALLIQIKPLLPDSTALEDEERDPFSEGMRLLQAYPEEDIGPVLEMAIIFRQRRLAADLTGDGPPEHDEEDASAGLSAMRNRAAQTLQRWGRSANAQASPMAQRSISASSASSGIGSLTPAKGSWFASMGRSFSNGAGTPQKTFDDSPDNSRDSTGGWASSASTPSRPSVGGVFQRYAEAFQSSDAAANFSKASTNLTAKALASFGSSSGNGSRETSPEPGPSPLSTAKMPSLGSVSASFFKKARSGSDGSSAIMGRESPRTPEMVRWSRDTMPDFPLPDVSDSPAGRTEYTDSSGKRMSLAYNQIHGRQSAVGSPTLSDATSEGGFGTLPLPSMRAATKLGILPRPRDSPSSSRGVGPKPLLLRQSARPPREGSNSGLYNADEPSRKVSSGPMAHAAGPSSRSTSRTGRDSSMAGSISGRSSRTPSETGSGNSNVDSPNTSMTSHHQVHSTLASLPSLNGSSAAAVVPVIPPEMSTVNPLSTMPGPVGLLGNADGTVSAGAFAKVRAAAAGSRHMDDAAGRDDAGDRDVHAPSFGQVSSSSNVPLVASANGTGGASISRPRPATNRKRGSSSTIGSTSNSVTGSVKSSRATSAAFSTSSAARVLSEEGDAEPRCVKSPDFESWAHGEAVELSDAPVQAADGAQPKRDSIFEKPRAAPAPPPVARSNGSAAELEAHAEEPTTFDAPQSTPPTRYELYDEPSPLPSSPTMEDGSRPSSATTKARTRSSSGIVRSKRFTKNRTSSSSITATGTAGARRSSASRPAIVVPADMPAEPRHLEASSSPVGLPSPGPGAGAEISTTELLDQLTFDEPAISTTTAPSRPLADGNKRDSASLQRPASYASIGSHSRSSAEGPDLLSDDMFAAPTASIASTYAPALYHERPLLAQHDDDDDADVDGDEERAMRRVSVPLSSTGSFFGQIDERGLEAIGSSLAFPESDVEDSFGDEFIVRHAAGAGSGAEVPLPVAVASSSDGDTAGFEGGSASRGSVSVQ